MRAIGRHTRSIPGKAILGGHEEEVKKCLCRISVPVPDILLPVMFFCDDLQVLPSPSRLFFQLGYVWEAEALGSLSDY